MEEMERQYQAYLAEIEAYLGRLFQTEAPYGRLQEAMRYSLLSGGKRVRPVLTLAFCLLVIGVALFLYYRPVHPDYRLLTPYERILKYKEYDITRGTDVYVDDLGDWWETSDGGRTFSRISPFSAVSDRSGTDKKIEGMKNE